MSKEIVLPTVEEAERIKHGNKELTDSYFLKNYDYIVSIAKRYSSRQSDFCWEDYVNEAYLNFGVLQFTKRSLFTYSLYQLFWLYRIGGKRKYAQLTYSKCGIEEYILDAPVNSVISDKETLMDILPQEIDFEEVIEPRPDISEALYKFLCEYLATEQKRVFEQFYWSGLTANEIALKLGKSPSNVRVVHKVFMDKFRRHKKDIYNWLVSVGYYEVEAV